MESVLRLVDMEASYLTVDFFRNLHVMDTQGSQTTPLSSPTTIEQNGERHFRKIASDVAGYIRMVADTLVNAIPKAVVHCQVRQAKLALLNYFYTQISQSQVCVLLWLIQFGFGLVRLEFEEWIMFFSQGRHLGQLLDENPALMERRLQCAKRLELYKKARDEIDAAVWFG